MSNIACNYTILQQDCTLDTCCLSQGTVNYIPNLAANITYAAIFVLLLASQLGLCMWYRPWTFTIGMILGLLCEVIGYAGRIWMHDSIFNMKAFLMYLICLTIGPAFLSASIYLCLSRIVDVYSASASRLRPQHYTSIFISCDLLSLTLQGAGGGIAATATTNQNQVNLGTNVMIAGLAFQNFAVRVRKVPESQRNEDYQSLRRTSLFRGFLLALGIATLAVFIRCCYRVAELQSGFGGALANNETIFEVLEGPMIMAAVIALTVCHPGFCLGSLWATIGASTGTTDKAAEVRSSSRLHRMPASMSQFAGRRADVDNEPGFEKAKTDSSVLNSKEAVNA